MKCSTRSTTLDGTCSPNSSTAGVMDTASTNCEKNVSWPSA